MRSNFIKALESCTVYDFSRSFYECPIRTLTVCVWKWAHICELNSARGMDVWGVLGDQQSLLALLFPNTQMQYMCRIS